MSLPIAAASAAREMGKALGFDPETLAGFIQPSSDLGMARRP